MIFYLYKIVNCITGKYYYGVHSTKNIDDGYMGSGVILKKAYKKYGIENFKKQIIKYFQNKQEMFLYEKEIVNDQLINDELCYNVICGGKDSFTMKQCSDISKKNRNKKQISEKMKIIAKEYWSTGNIQQKKNRIRKSLQKYWSTGDVETKHKNHRERIKKNFQNPYIKEKISNSLHKYWNNLSKQQRQSRGELVKNSKKFIESVEKQKQNGQYKSGYDNNDFKARWVKIYEQNRQFICQLLKYSNLPQDFIVNNIFKKKVKTVRLIKYYLYKHYLNAPIFIQKKVRFLRFENINNIGHKDGSSKKTYFSNFLKYDFMFYYDDFFDQFQKIKIIYNDMSVSDSFVVNNCYLGIKNYYQVIQYFQQLGIVKNKNIITIRVKKHIEGKKQFTIPAKKTVFQIDYQNINKIILNKEFKEYGIDHDGKAFEKGQFKLVVDGEECFL